MAQQALTGYQPDLVQMGVTEGNPYHPRMIDLIALSIPHFVLALAVWRLVSRADLDDDPALPRKEKRHDSAKPDVAKSDARP